MIFTRPHSPEDFHAALQHALDNGRMLMLDPDTRMEFTRPTIFHPRASVHPSGLSAHGAQLTWKSDGKYDTTMFKFETEAGQECRNLTIAGLSILGDKTAGSAPPAGKLVELVGRGGSAIRGFLIIDLNWEHACTALHLEGEVFEGYVVRPRGTYARDYGIVCRHGYEVPGVMSNIYILQPNISRMPAHLGTATGILCDYCSSVLIDGGNFISIDGPGIKGTNGVKRITKCDFENVGNINGAAIEIDRNDYWSQVIMCEGSNTGGSMQHLLAYGADPEKLDVEHCRMYNGEILAPPEYQARVLPGARRDDP